MNIVHAVCWVLLYVFVLPFLVAGGLTYLAQVTHTAWRTHHPRRYR